MIDIPTPQELRLRVELRAAHSRCAALDARLREMQAASEGAYRVASQTSGGARIDQERPFGKRSLLALGTLPLVGRHLLLALLAVRSAGDAA